MNRIKRLSTEILNEYNDKFGTDFSHNKQFLNEISIIRSKGLKNKIAGYITKILQRKQKFEDRKQELIENDKVSGESIPESTQETDPEPVVESTQETDPEPVVEPTQEKSVGEEILTDSNFEDASQKNN